MGSHTIRSGIPTLASGVDTIWPGSDTIAARDDTFAAGLHTLSSGIALPAAIPARLPWKTPPGAQKRRPGDRKRADDDKASDALDDFGEGAWGCTAIEYWNESQQHWGML